MKLEGLPLMLVAKLVFPDLVRIIYPKINEDKNYFNVNHELSKEVVEYLQDVCLNIESKSQT